VLPLLLPLLVALRVAEAFVIAPVFILPGSTAALWVVEFKDGLFSLTPFRLVCILIKLLAAPGSFIIDPDLPMKLFLRASKF